MQNDKQLKVRSYIRRETVDYETERPDWDQTHNESLNSICIPFSSGFASDKTRDLHQDENKQKQHETSDVLRSERDKL